MRLTDGDYQNGTNGESEALLQEALFRLTARRGSFPFLPDLGSRMYRLRQEKPSAWDTLAVQYAAEALSGLADVTVTGAQVNRTENRLAVEVSLLWQGETLTVAAQLEG